MLNLIALLHRLLAGGIRGRCEHDGGSSGCDEDTDYRFHRVAPIESIEAVNLDGRGPPPFDSDQARTTLAGVPARKFSTFSIAASRPLRLTSGVCPALCGESTVLPQASNGSPGFSGSS